MTRREWTKRSDKEGKNLTFPCILDQADAADSFERDWTPCHDDALLPEKRIEDNGKSFTCQ